MKCYFNIITLILLDYNIDIVLFKQSNKNNVCIIIKINKCSDKIIEFKLLYFD